MVEKEIELGVRLPDAEDVARAEDILAKAKGPVLQEPAGVYARETVAAGEVSRPRVKVKLQAIRIGDLGIAAIPCEVFAEIGLEIKKKSPLKPTFTIELANGYNGYLPTPEQHGSAATRPGAQRASYLEVDASTKITSTLLELLEQGTPMIAVACRRQRHPLANRRAPE